VGFGQAAVVFPFIVAAPRFFSGAIQLGELMQIASAFGRVQDSLSWFVDNYDRLASWRATTDRITSFEESFQGLQQARPVQGRRRRDRNDRGLGLGLGLRRSGFRRRLLALAARQDGTEEEDRRRERDDRRARRRDRFEHEPSLA
jgi:hypothetical protein